MEDDKLANLHSSYKSQAEQRGKKGGLGVNEVYNFGFNQETNANGLTKDPKQPYIRFVKAGYKPPQASNKTLFADSDADSEPEVETTKKKTKTKTQNKMKKMKKSKAKSEEKSGGTKRKRSSLSDDEQQNVRKKKKLKKEKKEKKEKKLKQNGKVEQKKQKKKKKTKTKSNKAEEKKSDSSKQANGKLKKNKEEGCENVKCFRLSRGEDVLSSLEQLTDGKKCSLLTVKGDLKILKGKDGAKTKAVTVHSAEFKKDTLHVVAVSTKGKVVQTTIAKGTKAGECLRVILLHP